MNIFRNQQSPEGEQQNYTDNNENAYTFRWSYADQTAFEREETKTKAKRGPLTFAIVMAVSFAVCFLLLCGVLIWYGGSASTADGSAVAVAEQVTPSTVLVYASGGGSYGYGTGFFITSDGYIVTNYHVIEGGTTVLVTLSTGVELDAAVVGYSVYDDIAVLKVSGNRYPAVTIGDSDLVRVGETAIAIGNPGGKEGAWSTTQGIISNCERQVVVNDAGVIYELTMLQTDAPVNTGNSGGPLCNARGEVIGIVTRKMTGYEGIGLALPINGSMEIVRAIMRDGHADNVTSSISKVRPTLGIQCYDIKAGEEFTYNGTKYAAQSDGILVSEITAGSGADGVLQIADIIVAMDGTAVENTDEMKRLLFEHRAGDEVELTVIRGGERQTVKIVLGKK